MANGPRKRGLTVKAEKFVKAMADPENESGTKAAIKAGYSPNGAAVTATELLKNPNIKDRIEQRKAEVAKYANINSAQILGATALRAFATIDDAFDDNGHFSIAKARETGAIHLIKKIARTQTQFGENVAVEFYSNESAQDRLGQYLGLEKQPAENPADVTDVADEIVRRLVGQHGFTEDEARAELTTLYPELGVAAASDAIN